MQFQEIIKELWEDPLFTEVLHEATTTKEYDRIESFIANPDCIEALTSKKGVTSSDKCSLQLEKNQLLREIHRTSTFSNWYTNFFFEHDGSYASCLVC